MTDAELIQLRDGMARAMQPNDNALGDWKAEQFSAEDASLCGPAYRHDPHRRMLVSVVGIDGLTDKEAGQRSLEVASFIIAAVNEALARCRAAEAGVVPGDKPPGR